MRYLVLLLLLTGCVTITGYEGEQLQVRATEVGLQAVNEVVETTEKELVALVKGSIYESGEIMSVFGTCLDADDYPIAGVNATFSAWYPNGTQFIFDQNITEMQTGYFLYTGPMEPVRGTYLTRLQCELNGSIALAFGEWQNPYWVARINETQSLLNVTIDEINENQALIENLSYDVAAGFNETFIQINNTNTLINDSTTVILSNISYVAQVANDSVDRNDSFIVELLYQILNNGTPTTGLSGAVSFTEEFEQPVFFDDWTINVTAFIGGTQVGNEYISCFINTTNNPPATGEQMEPIDGPKFTYTERVQNLNTFDWDVWCEAI